MGVVDVLRRLGPTDELPSLDRLGGEDVVREELPGLPAEVIPDLIAVVASDSYSVDDLDALGADLAGRLSSEVSGPLSFARGADSLLRIAVARPSGRLALVVMDAFLMVATESTGGGAGALRRGHAIRAAVDLGLLEVGASVHAPLSAIERMTDIPAEMAPALSRAVGRLSEHSDSGFLTELLETDLVRHEGAAADALLELALGAMRAAFSAPDPKSTEADLRRAIELLDRACRHDSDRPDARAFQAAARAVIAFAEDPEALSTVLDELLAAHRELEMYSVGRQDQFRGAEPLRNSAAWLVLASELAALRNHLDHPDLLNLAPGVRELASAYSGVRLAVLEDERLGFTKFIQPVIQAGVEVQPGLPEALGQLAGVDDSPALTEELAGAVMRPKARSRQTCRGRSRLPRRR
jgi:hypothetical protein